jgi:hypothetical protein
VTVVKRVKYTKIKGLAPTTGNSGETNSGDIHDKYCQGKNNIIPWPSPKPPVAFQLAKSDIVTLLRYVIFVPCLCQKEWDLLARHPFAASGHIPIEMAVAEDYIGVTRRP